MSLVKYRGRTERGRECVEDSLDDAAGTVAFLHGLDPNDAITVQHDASTWYVYDSQASADLDAGRPEPHHWYALVMMEPAGATGRVVRGQAVAS